MEPIKFTNPFAEKKKQLQEAAGLHCLGCGEPLSTPKGEDSIRKWCSRPRRNHCKKKYRNNLNAK